MSHGLGPEEWSSLSIKERLSRCRLSGAEARQFALQAGGGQTRKLLLSVAAAWDQLADELERDEQNR